MKRRVFFVACPLDEMDTFKRRIRDDYGDAVVFETAGRSGGRWEPTFMLIPDSVLERDAETFRDRLFRDAENIGQVTVLERHPDNSVTLHEVSNGAEHDAGRMYIERIEDLRHDADCTLDPREPVAWVAR